MSSITRCPACQTMFRVVPDQLRMSEGWVRCGHCEAVFDATEHMVPEMPLAAPFVPDFGPIDATAADNPRTPGGLASNEAVGASGSDWIERPAHAQRHAANGDQATYAMPLDDFMSDQQDTVAAPPDFDLHIEAPATTGAKPATANAPAELDLDIGEAPAAVFATGKSGAALGGTLADIDLPLPPNATPGIGVEPSFLRNKPMPPTRSGRRARGKWLTMGALLVVAFALQFMYRERDRLASSWPALKPGLVQVCGMLGCAIGPLRQIDALAIDSSSFSFVRGDVYRLNVVLKNMHSTDLAAPAIELTLTDTQDRAVLRRVIPANAFEPMARVVTAGGEWSASMWVHVNSVPGADRVAGYRVLAFYP